MRTPEFVRNNGNDLKKLHGKYRTNVTQHRTPSMSGTVEFTRNATPVSRSETLASLLDRLGSAATVQGVATTAVPDMARPTTLPYAPRLPAPNAPKVKRVKDYAVCVSGAVRAMMMQEVMDLWFKNVVNVTMHSPNGADFFYHLFVGTELSKRGQSGLSKADAQNLSSALGYATQFQLQYTENSFTCDTMATGRFFKLAECAKMIKLYQERENVSYNFIIFTRPDLLFYKPAPDFNQCEKPSGGRWYMGMIGGVEADLFAISGDALDVVERAVQAESWFC